MADCRAVFFVTNHITSDKSRGYYTHSRMLARKKSLSLPNNSSIVVLQQS